MKASEVRVDELLREASAAHAKRLPLDNRAPFEVLPVGEARDVALYLEACHAGDHASCWIALELDLQDVHARKPTNQDPTITPAGRDAAMHLDADCRAGDHQSCVALPTEDDAGGLRFSDAPGAVGRSHACQSYEIAVLRTCPEDKIHAECEAGFARSCRVEQLLVADAATQAPGTTTTMERTLERTQELEKHAGELSLASCRARISDQCVWAPAELSEDDRLFVATTLCDLDQRCSGLAAILLARGDVIAARNAAERGCQFFRDRCAELGVMYLDGKLPEPEPGRGQRIVDFVCDSLRRSAGEKIMQGYRPCARAKLGPKP